MSTGITSSRSILDKPLNEITEEDMSQLTREDCRRYLKAKGMRRPSWNKAQALQQVICLKSLLETTQLSGAGTFSNVAHSSQENGLPVTSNSADSIRESSPDADVQISVSADESVPYCGKDFPKSAPSGALAGCAPHTDSNAISPRDAGATSTNWYVGQMTIFYCGKVNIYDEVPVDKAQAIMHLAASPTHFPQDDLSSRTTGLWSFPCHLQTANVKVGPLQTGSTTEKLTGCLRQCREEGNHTYESEVHVNRKILLQRYLEKQKDRCTGKLNLKTPHRSYGPGN